MKTRTIKPEADYIRALKRLETIFDAKIGTTESIEADALAQLVNEHEKKHYPIAAPDPIKAHKIRMEETRSLANNL